MISWITIWVKSENFEVFFFYSFHFCRLINQTFFQASEWLKETQSCSVWHFLWCKNNLNDSMLCVKFVKLVDPFLFLHFLSMFKAPIFEIWYFRITWMTEFLKDKGIQFSKIFIFIDQLGHIMCEIRKFWSFFYIFCSFLWADKSNFFLASERNSFLLSLIFLYCEKNLNESTLCVKLVHLVDPFLLFSFFSI